MKMNQVMIKAEYLMPRDFKEIILW